jgi:hypothetical protein
MALLGFYFGSGSIHFPFITPPLLLFPLRKIY